MARIIQVIEVATMRGTGKEGDQFTLVTEYWSPDGRLLGDNTNTKRIMDMCDKVADQKVHEHNVGRALG